jgi:RHS repeat-associated protein
VGGPSVSSTYGYDSIYRLTQESVVSAGVQADNGALTYGLDAVGNRQSLTSTLAAIATQPAMSYNVNDRLVGNSYDANGNTLGAGGKTFAYDSQDRLTSFNGGAVTMVYDGDGNRVSKTAGGVTTLYLVDEANPTGLAQVVEELSGGGVVQKRYVYGLERIGQTQVASAVTSFYGYDGHGDVRYLMDVTGAVTDTYDYDAFGNVVGSTGTTANVYRYQGEALDAETGLYYLRARYYDPVAGRFLSVDPMADQGQHPYTYAGADPVNGHDPTGQEASIIAAIGLAAFTPSVSVVAGIRDDIKCLWSLTGSIISNPGFMIGRLAGCVGRFFDPQEPGGGGGGGGNGQPPVKPCSNPIYCDSVVLPEIKSAFMRAVLANSGFDPNNSSQHEAGFSVGSTCDGCQARRAEYGEANGQLSIPVPTGRPGATFHTHMAGNGMPSTPGNNVSGGRDAGDTLRAHQTNYDVYVISKSGLAVAPADDPGYMTGAGSHFIIQGKNFNDWYNRLLRQCAASATGTGN